MQVLGLIVSNFTLQYPHVELENYVSSAVWDDVEGRVISYTLQRTKE